MACSTQSSLGALGIKTDQPECFRYDKHFQEVIQRLHSRVDLCDVVLIVGKSGKRITAHRLILVGFSEFFSDLLSEPTNESNKREVKINSVDEDACEKLIKYCYTGNLELEGETIAVLLTTAIGLRLEKVVEGCCEFIHRHLKPTNSLAVASLAEQLKLEPLLCNTWKFACENFKEVSNQSEFSLLSAEQLSELMAADECDVPSEEFVFDVLVKWIKHEPKTRWKHFPQLLTQVRLSLLSHSFLKEKVAPLCNTLESKNRVLKLLSSQQSDSSKSAQPRKFMLKNLAKHMLAIYKPRTVNTKQDDSLIIAGYNLQTKAWSICNTTVKGRSHFAAVFMDNNLIMVGGFLNGLLLNTVTSLNLSTLASTEMASLGTARYGHRVEVLKSSIYVIGGFGLNEILNTVERWDPTTGKWRFVAPMIKEHCSPGVAVLYDHLYVSAGHTIVHHSIKYLTCMECYHAVKNIWRCTASMKVGRSSHCVKELAAYKGYLFAIGGQNSQNNCPVERYDPRTDTWTTICCSPSISGRTKSILYGSDIFIYNDSNIYKLCSDTCCENLQLHHLFEDSKSISENFNDLTHFVALPNNCSPPKTWVKK